MKQKYPMLAIILIGMTADSNLTAWLTLTAILAIGYLIILTIPRIKPAISLFWSWAASGASVTGLSAREIESLKGRYGKW